MRQLVATFAVMMFVGLGCGGDTYESLAKESLAVTKELVAALDGVKDEASATSAKPALKKIVEKMNSINQRQAKLGVPTEAQMKPVFEKYGKEMEELQQKMVGHMMRIGFDPKIRAVLDDIDMKKIAQ
jgi:hypothetical protein